MSPGPARCSASSLADDPHLFDELRGRLRAGAEKPVAEPNRAAQRLGMVAADPHRRVRLLDGLGLHRGAVELPEVAVERDLGSVQQAFISAMPSLKRATRLSGLTPNAANGRPRPPVPTPTSTRPPLRRSSVAIAFARWTGCAAG